MPNHLHGIIITEGAEIAEYAETHRDASLGIVQNILSHIIRGFRGSATNRIRKSGRKQFHWQSRINDHIIRNETDLR